LETGLSVKIMSVKGYKNDLNLKKNIISISLIFMFFSFSSEFIFAQEHYYFHTIHSHGLSATFGRTAKVNYMYQIGHNRQVKLSGAFIYDSYDQGKNHIKANIYDIKAQLQYKLINKNDFFLNMAFGGGGYYLSAKDLLAIKHREGRFNFVAGFQAEYYIMRNSLALTMEYDIFYMPWSKIYEFLHVPTAGVTWFFL